MFIKRTLAFFCVIAMGVTMTACKKSEAKEINSPDDFSGAKIAVQTATTASESIAELNKDKKIKISEYEKITQCFDDLELDRVDAVYVDSVVAAYYTTGSTKYKRTWLSDVAEPMAICMRKDSADLAAAVEAAVDTLYYNGKMAEIAKTHFGSDFTPVRTVTEEPTLPDFKLPGGVFKVGMEVGYPPMEYTEKDGVTYKGFDVDVAKAIAELLGGQAQFVNTAWDGIFASLDKGEYDAIISAVSINDERDAKYLLTKPYIANALCIVQKINDKK
ncbi:hypothetical protein FACS1894132_00790 [Clostridia bacterium]|nr:hypothetical protein FACS1894132_00790 [Clostridia bacterium]